MKTNKKFVEGIMADLEYYTDLENYRFYKTDDESATEFTYKGDKYFLLTTSFKFQRITAVPTTAENIDTTNQIYINIDDKDLSGLPENILQMFADYKAIEKNLSENPVMAKLVSHLMMKVYLEWERERPRGQKTALTKIYSNFEDPFFNKKI